MTEKDRTIAALHLLLAELHMALATNRAPAYEVANIADGLCNWWTVTCSGRAALAQQGGRDD